MKRTPIVSAVLTSVLACGAALFLSAGCQSTHEEGVTSDMRSQWTTVMANTEASTAAAKAVLESEGLKDITASSTAVDGKATGKKADGTKIDVSIKKKTDTSSEVTVTVGTMGSPTLGAELAKKIKEKAEAK